MSWTCPRCQQPVFFGEAWLSWGKACGHNGRPYCHKPCYGALFGPRGVNIGGVGSYLYKPPTPTPASITRLNPSSFSPPRPRTGLPQGKKSPPHMKTFTGETSLCPGCEEPVYFAETVMSLGRNWHRPCLRCQRCRKTLTAGSHAEVSRAGVGDYAGREAGKEPTPPQTLGLKYGMWVCVDNFPCGQTHCRPLPDPSSLQPSNP
uniref:Cysteine rich protein 3 n=1 Tax=Capra hircus TaxID=9925 RepID=A0A452EVZ6_CAPHI